jgi:hypothetical protein
VRSGGGGRVGHATVEEKGTVSELETIVAQAYRLRGKSRLNRTEFTFVLAYDLKWFSAEQSKEVLEAALKQGLLKDENGKLIPTFNIKTINVPKDFKPGTDILAEKSLLDKLLDLLAMAGIDRETALRMIKDKEEQYGNLVTPETAALVIAKEKKLNAGPLIDDAYRQLHESKN